MDDRYPQATRSPSADDINIIHKMSKLKLYMEQIESFANRRDFLNKNQYLLDLEAKDLQKRQKELDEESQKLGQECHLVDIAVVKLEREISLKEALIPFVATIQDAQQYFQLKQYVIEKKYDYGPHLLPCEITQFLLNDSDLRSKFIIIPDLQFDRLAYAMFFINMPCKMDPVLKNPVYQLVHRSLQTGDVMDPDPMVELRRIMESDPGLYDDTFRSHGLPRGCWEDIKSEEDARKKYSQLRVKDIIGASNAEPVVEKSEEVEEKATYVYAEYTIDGFAKRGKMRNKPKKGKKVKKVVLVI